MYKRNKPSGVVPGSVVKILVKALSSSRCIIETLERCAISPKLKNQSKINGSSMYAKNNNINNKD